MQGRLGRRLMGRLSAKTLSGPGGPRWLVGRRRLPRRTGERGSIMVEMALTLPIMLLLTVGGISILWWLHNKAMMQVTVAEVARERAADGMVTGYYKDVVQTLHGPPRNFGTPDLRFVSFHLPLDPPFVMAAACNTPGGMIPEPPDYRGAEPAPAPRRSNTGWLGPVADVRELLEEGVAAIREGESAAAEWADRAVRLGEQLLFHRKALENALGQEPHFRRQALDYAVGGAVEAGMEHWCAGPDGAVSLAAKAVIQGERTYGQR